MGKRDENTVLLLGSSCTCGRHKGIGQWCAYERAATYARMKANQFNMDGQTARWLEDFESVHGEAIPLDFSDMRGRENSFMREEMKRSEVVIDPKTQCDNGRSKDEIIQLMKNRDLHTKRQHRRLRRKRYDNV